MVEGLRSPGGRGSTQHWRTRTCKGGYRSPLCNPRSRPATSPLRGSLASISSLQVGRDTASCLSRPQPHIPVGLTWLVNCASAMLMPDTTPRLTFLCCELREELSGYWKLRNPIYFNENNPFWEIFSAKEPHSSQSNMIAVVCSHSPVGTAEAFAAGRGKPQGCGLRAGKTGCRISPDPKPDAISRGYREVAVTSGGAGVARGRRRAPLARSQKTMPCGATHF